MTTASSRFFFPSLFPNVHESTIIPLPKSSTNLEDGRRTRHQVLIGSKDIHEKRIEQNIEKPRSIKDACICPNSR